MRNAAFYYGLWAGLCMALAILAFFAVADLSADHAFKGTMFDGPAPFISAIVFLLPFCIPTAIVAGLAWAVFHRDGRDPGWLGYGLLALLVVAVSHVLIFATASITTGETNVKELASGIGFMFLLHCWLSVPSALLGTAAFVLWERHEIV